MAASRTRKPSRKRALPDPLTCHLCPVSAATETDLVSHLVEEHGAVWTSTNSFGLDDLVIPTPRESFDDRQAEQPSWVRRLISRSGH